MTFLNRQLQVLKLLRHLNQPLTDPELTVVKDSFSPLNNLNKFKVTAPSNSSVCCYVSQNCAYDTLQAQFIKQIGRSRQLTSLCLSQS
jgi:hypothetical protein